MAKKSDDVTAQNDAILPSSTKDGKLRPSKIPLGSSRLSHLLSKISRKDKKALSNYYIPAEPPFTSTPDMSGEEDGIEVSYVETESENNGSSEDTIPAADSANRKSTPNRVIYVDSAVLDDSTTTTTASAEYSSSSASWNTNTEEMIRTSVTACTPSDQRVVQPKTQTKVSTIDVNANFKSRLRKVWYIITIGIQLFLAIFVLFWSLIILKIFYDDFYNTRSEPSMLCGATELIDEWLWLDLSKAIHCSDNSNNFLERLHHEAELFITFTITQFRVIPTIWSSLTSETFIQFYEEWLQGTVQKTKENLNKYYETIWTNVKEYYNFL
uniref:Inner nuclear membrane protein Man1 n=1 Tax=Elaeophora elaphi TaxID=1147741 RepID=A0A0R3RUU5_9BILA